MSSTGSSFFAVPRWGITTFLGVVAFFFSLSGAVDAADEFGFDLPPIPVIAPDFPGIASPGQTSGIGENPAVPGLVEISVETVREQTPRMRSMTAEKVEVWRGDRLLAMVARGSPRVAEQGKRRTFNLPAIPLPPGYHFLTIRVYAEGFLSRENKWKGRTMQIGVKGGQTTYIRKTFPFFVW